jgi:hypothetical protein
LTLSHSPVCQKEIMNFSDDSEQPSLPAEVIFHRKPHSRPKKRQTNLDEKDIWIAKRIVRQILDREPKSPNLPLERDVVLATLLERAREAVKRLVAATEIAVLYENGEELVLLRSLNTKAVVVEGSGVQGE